MCLNFSLILIKKVLDFILCDKEEEESQSGSLISCISPSSSSSKPSSSSSPPYPKSGSYFAPPPPPPSRSLPSYPKPPSLSSRSSYSSSSKILPSVPSSSPSPLLPPPSPSPSSPKPAAASSLISPPPRSPSSYPKSPLSSSRSYSSSTKPTLFPAPPSSSSSKNQHNQTNIYIRIDKGTPIYVIPEKIKPLLEKGIVPDILKKALYPSTYKDYFDTLLFSEDYYLEKWDGFDMKSVTLELHKASINYSRIGKFKNKNANDEKVDKIFVAFEIDNMCLNFSLILIIKVLDFILCDKEEEEEESQLGSSVSLISCISPSSSYSKPSSPPYHKPGSYFSPPPPIQLYPKPAASSFISPSPRLLPSYPKPASSSSRSSYSSSSKILPSVPLSSPPPPPLSYPKPTSSFSLPPPPSPSSPKPAASSLISPPTRSPSSYPKPALSSSRSYSSSTKPTLFPAPPSSSKNQQNLTNYIRVDKGTPIYIIPEKIKHLLEKDIVPDILKKPLSPSTYKDYFDTLLYAEDYYLEKWDGFELKSVALELHKASINYSRKGKFKNINANDEKDDKIFVAFEIDKIPVRLPFLLSRDFASARPSGSKVEPFQGIIYRVLRSRLVLVEFGEDFHSQHYLGCKYDVKFSFNRVCLKRAHQAIAAASDSLLQNFIFPDSCIPRNTLTTSRPLSIIDHKVLNMKQVSIVHEMLRLHGPPPYLVEGPISVIKSKVLSRTGIAVKEAVLQIYRTFPVCRILICAPINSTCDVIMRSLRKEIPESSMFRANAAFRELDGVPLDILPSCVYKGECFSCPSLQELQEFKVILSTFMSSVRLQNVGIMAGHFSHIFLVDASSATEPETMVALANLANETTSVVITGAPRNRSGWIRSSIARQNGLMTSYFERLTESKLYSTLDPRFITQLED